MENKIFTNGLYSLTYSGMIDLRFALVTGCSNFSWNSNFKNSYSAITPVRPLNSPLGFETPIESAIFR